MPNPDPVILVIEDEAPIRRFLRTALTNHGYQFVEAATAKDGLEAALQQPDLIILDLGLPDLDGLEVVRQLREWTFLPIIILSVRGHESVKVSALDAGADDYLTKPFSVEELLARIRVVLRHATNIEQKSEEPIFTVDDWKVDLSKRQVFVGEREIHLTPIEYKLLTTLIRYAGKVITHRQLLKEVWGSAYSNETQYLHVYMTRLRHKLECDPARPQHLMLELGVGYRLKVD
jgi:two-component system, OmpR family, KDP operon response regulator KdpE